jgi:hypothetical protein
MVYDLEAVIASGQLLESQRERYRHAEVISLPSRLQLIPVTNELFAELNSGFPDVSREFASEKLSPAVVSWLEDLSASAPVMYCEAEFFGGIGGQLAVIWHKRQVVFGPVRTRSGQDGQPYNVSSLSEMSINCALRELGIKAVVPRDEFDTVELGRYRHTKDWRTIRSASNKD